MNEIVQNDQELGNISEVEIRSVENEINIPNKSSRKPSGLLMVFLAIFAFLVVGLFIYMNVTSKSAYVASPSPTPDLTSNWKTIGTDEGPYRFKLPQDWEIMQENFQAHNNIINAGYKSASGKMLVISRSSTQTLFTVNDNDNEIILSNKQIVVNKLTIERVLKEINDDQIEQDKKPKILEYKVPSGNKTISISFIHSTDNPEALDTEDEKLFDQIISTFELHEIKEISESEAIQEEIHKQIVSYQVFTTNHPEIRDDQIVVEVRAVDGGFANGIAYVDGLNKNYLWFAKNAGFSTRKDMPKELLVGWILVYGTDSLVDCSVLSKLNFPNSTIFCDSN